MVLEGTLGPLMPHDQLPTWLVSGPVDVPLFSGAALPFFLEDILADPDPEDFRDAVRAFLALAASELDTATRYVYRNYRDFMESVEPDEDDVAIDDPAGVWEHVAPTSVHVRRRKRDGRIYVQVGAECAWEREHGLMLTYRDGRALSRVSAVDEHAAHADAYGLPESEDRIAKEQE